MWVDSHCHLGFDGLGERLDDVLLEMDRAHVSAALCVCTTLEEADHVLDLSRRSVSLWASVGVHPDTESTPQHPHREPTVETLVARAQDPKIRAIGETGLDYYRLNGRSMAEMAWQRDRFAVHIEAARQSLLPLIVHTRCASEDTLNLLAQEGRGQVGGVFHCFTETAEVARAALDLGFYISFSGILTFKNAADLREVARWVPLDRCLVETDSPYLAPVPYRGKTNQPAYVAQVGRALAQIKSLTEEEVSQATTRNFEQLFGVSVKACD